MKNSITHDGATSFYKQETTIYDFFQGEEKKKKKFNFCTQSQLNLNDVGLFIRMKIYLDVKHILGDSKRL